MADINGGELHFTATLDNEQLNSAVDETLKRVQGLSDGTASAGAGMQSTFDELEANVTRAMNTIDKNIEFNNKEIESLKAKFAELGVQMQSALAEGNESLALDAKAARQEIEKEIASLSSENNELERSRATVREHAQAMQENKQAQQQNEQAQISLKSQIKAVKEEMDALRLEAVRNGQTIDENTGRYAELKNELGMLTDVQGDLSTQAKVLANDEAKIAGVINGLSGLSGAMSAVTGTVSLFAGESENLQKVMTKLQSVMAITMGLQQVQQTLNKDSAFSLTTLAHLREWYAGIVAKAAGVTTADTVATTANVAATNAEAAATAGATTGHTAHAAAATADAVATTAAGTAATASAGAFKVLGTAIKSIPVIGWLLAAASALIALSAKLIKNQKAHHDAAVAAGKAVRDAAEEERKAINQTASSNISKIEELSRAYSRLGNNFDAQKKFVDANKEAFRSLGVEINSVNDATQLLIDKKDDYVRAQLEYAKADVYREKAKKIVEENADMFAKYDEIEAKKHAQMPVYGGNGATAEFDTRTEAEKLFQQEVANLVETARQDINKLFDKAFNAEEVGNRLTSAFNKGGKGADAAAEKAANSVSEKFRKQLAEMKDKYAKFFEWANSADEGVREAAKTEFAGLTEEGADYLDYLKKQRAAIMQAIGDSAATNDQKEQLRVLNEQIAAETKDTVLSQFDAELQAEMKGAQSLVDMLEIIKKKREEVKASDADESVKDAEQKELDAKEAETQKAIAEKTEELVKQYRTFNDRLVDMDKEYLSDLASLKRAYNAAEAAGNETEMKRIQSAIEARKQAYSAARRQMNTEELNMLANASDAYNALFENAQSASKKLTKQVLEDAKTIMRAVKGEAVALPQGISKELVNSIKQSPEEIKQLQDLIDKLQDTQDTQSGYAFAGLIGGFKKLATARKDYAAAAKGTAEEIARADARLKAAEEGAIKDICDGLVDVGSLLGSIGGQLQELGEYTEDPKLKAFGTMLEQFSTLSNSMLEGYKNGGAMGAAMSGMSTVISQIMTSYVQMAQAMYDMQQSQKAYADAMLEASLTLKDIYNNGFGERSFDRIKDATDAARRSLEEYRNSLNGLNADTDVVVGTETGFFEVILAGIKGLFNGGDLSSLDITSTLHELAPEIFNADGTLNYSALKAAFESGIFDEDSKIKSKVKEIITAYDKFIENQKVVAEYLSDMFGYLSTDAVDALTDAIINGGDAWEEWRKKGSKAIESLGEQLIYELFLADRFDEFSKNLKSVFSGEGEFAGLDYTQMSEKAVELMSQFFDSMQGDIDAAQQWGETWKEMADRYGFSIWSAGEDSSSATTFSGAVKTVTEHTASIISGQMNAIRMRQVEANETLRQQLSALYAIRSNTAYLQKIYNKISAVGSGIYEDRIHQNK